eukprot:Mrub_10993.p1 GENE.Mrub_10993~~Mrub_10993.p1  ORF type:complete len:190 (+),score=62.20 Mrub_10993:1-570(+)
MVATQYEQAIDDQLNYYENLMNDDEELKKIREKRMKEMQQNEMDKRNWERNGHGSITEITDQKEFFNISKQSRKVLALFYTRANKWSGPITELLSLLCQKHMEVKVVRVDAEKAPFLVEKLKIWMIPTIMCIKDQKTEQSLVGLDEIDCKGKLSIEKVENTLFEYGMLTDKYFEGHDHDSDDGLHDLDA